MDFCMLTDRLPVALKGIKMDTRTSTALSCVNVLAERLTEESKVSYLGDALFGQPLAQVANRAGCTLQEMADEVMWYLAGEPKNVNSNATQSVKDFDFVEDDERIVSAFRQVYGLSLDDTCNLHWWEFLALFKCLPLEGNTFGQVRDIRSRKPRQSDTAEMKAELAKAKKAVALKDNRTESEKRKATQKAIDSLDL